MHRDYPSQNTGKPCISLLFRTGHAGGSGGELVPTGEVYFDREDALALNDAGAGALFEKLIRGCCIPMGATAFVREEFLAQGDFDEAYRLIEDWPYFVRTALAGCRYLYIDAPVLLYRAGGVSRSEGAHPVYEKCCTDHLRVYEREIIPNLGCLDKLERLRVYYTYSQCRMNFARLYGVRAETSRFRTVLSCKGLARQCLLFRIKSAKRITLFVLVWAALTAACLLWGVPEKIPTATVLVLAVYALTGFVKAAAHIVGYLFGRG